VAYADGRCVVPPVGELQFDDPPGETHIKYGYIRDAPYFVVKVASGFYGNAARGLPTGSGLMVVFDRETGVPLALLDDGGWLTDLRTAVVGAIAADALAPSRVERIGILGTGVQARLQLLQLRHVTECRRVLAWGRTPAALERYTADLAGSGFDVESAASAAEVARSCELIVTTTPATVPLLGSGLDLAGKHITAVGSDTPGKQELHASILGQAGRVFADSRSQALERGEAVHAVRSGLLAEENVIELGHVLSGKTSGRRGDDELTIADLTGVAVSDVQIATAALEACAAE
jgi:ornithine cyclodeaminase